jgi:toluene monooxygenase electron transfer component
VTLQVSKFINAADPGACAPVACQGVLRGARLLTHDVMAFGIELERACDFEAGQFVVLAAPGVEGYRGYSMINFERSARRVDFVVKKKPGGAFSEWLFAAPREGATLAVFGPLGKATFYPALASNLLCIAGGSGIAGMMSILARAAQEHYFERHRGWVFFGVRTMRDAFFLQELSTHAAKVKVTIALSEEQVPATAAQRWPALAFAHGLVHEVARNKYENVRAYVAGPPPAVDAALRMLLLEAKLTSDNIRYDKYS